MSRMQVPNTMPSEILADVPEARSERSIMLWMLGVALAMTMLVAVGAAAAQGPRVAQPAPIELDAGHEKGVATKLLATQWIDAYFPPSGSRDTAYYVELFSHAMGSDFNVVPGATTTHTRTQMANKLLEVLDTAAWSTERSPVVLTNAGIGGRPATFLFGANGSGDWAQIYWNQDYATTTESSAAYYLEQLGHLFNWARCSVSGVSAHSFGVDGCPTSVGGSSGARIRDVLLAIGATNDIELLDAFAVRMPLREQLQAHYNGSDTSTIVHSDGVSAVAPIDIVRDRNLYHYFGVNKMLESDGLAGRLFDYLESEHAVNVPDFAWQGWASSPRFEFVVQGGVLTQVKYWQSSDVGAGNLDAKEFWYMVAQALTDAIHGPLASGEKCTTSTGASPDYLKLSDVVVGSQTEECLHRDTVAHSLAGILLHENNYDADDQTLLDELYGTIFPTSGSRRSLSEVAEHWVDAYGNSGNLHTNECDMGLCIKGETTIETVSQVHTYEQNCTPKVLEDYQDPNCHARVSDLACMVYVRESSGAWHMEPRSCDEERRIVCTTAQETNGEVTISQSSMSVTQNNYKLRYADEACLLEFPERTDRSSSKIAVAWFGSGLTGGNSSMTELGTSGVECGKGTKRSCENEVACTHASCSTSSEWMSPNTPHQASRKRFKPTLRNAIRFGGPPTKTVTATKPNQSLFNIHSLNIGAGSCHLVQCLKFDQDQKLESAENVLVDCGVTRDNPALGTLDGAGVVNYLRESIFYGLGTTLTPLATGFQYEPPIVVVSHPDVDHFSHIPNIFSTFQLPAGDHRSDPPDHLYLGGKPEEYVANYQNGALALPGRGPRSHFRTYLAETTAEWMVDGNPLPLNGDFLRNSNPDTLPGTLQDNVYQWNPLLHGRTIKTFDGCPGAELTLVTVNTNLAPGGSNAVQRNEVSAVLAATYTIEGEDYFGAILAGDATGATEQAASDAMTTMYLPAWQNKYSHRFLTASHHGSGTHGSNGGDWITFLDPKYTIYSSGHLHRHPHNTAVDRYEAANLYNYTYQRRFKRGFQDRNQNANYVDFFTNRGHRSTRSFGSIVSTVTYTPATATTASSRTWNSWWTGSLDQADPPAN